MTAATIVKKWFETWERGDFNNLPITDNFCHKSPFGTISGKENYLNLVRQNKDKFIGYNFEIEDVIYMDNKACIRYLAIQEDFKLEVSEWHYIMNNQISSVIAYYHIEEIKEDRKLRMS